MRVRVITKSDEPFAEGEIYHYKLLSAFDVEYGCDLAKTMEFFKQNDLSLIVNTENLADTDGVDYFVKEVEYVVPPISYAEDEQILPYLSVYVE